MSTEPREQEPKATEQTYGLGRSPEFDLNDILTKEQLVAKYPHLLTEGQLNWALRMRASNGLSESGAVVKNGGELCLIRPLFVRWLLNQKA